jgi:hypothetical protein
MSRTHWWLQIVLAVVTTGCPASLEPIPTAGLAAEVKLTRDKA